MVSPGPFGQGRQREKQATRLVRERKWIQEMGMQEGANAREGADVGK